MVENVYEALAHVQARVAIPKNRKNDFAGYSFRNVEDIHAVAKPACNEIGAVYYVTDSIEEQAGRVYVKATALFAFKGEVIAVSAWAREQAGKKGMDEAQVTGLASSYARKYALQGLFAIDNDPDPDQLDNRQDGPDAPASETQCDELGDLMATFAMLKGKEVQDVVYALESAKSMRSAKVDSYTRRDAEKAIAIVKKWIESTMKVEEN